MKTNPHRMKRPSMNRILYLDLSTLYLIIFNCKDKMN